MHRIITTIITILGIIFVTSSKALVSNSFFVTTSKALVTSSDALVS